MTAPRPIGYWVKAVDQLIDAQFASAAAELGVTRRQWQILNVVGDGGGSTRAEVATALSPFLPPGESLEPQLDGIGELVTVEGDRLALTLSGRERLEEAKVRSVGRLRDRVAEGLTREDYDTTLRTLEQIARNLGWSDVPG